MVYCSGCSQMFQVLSDGRCGRCKILPSTKEKENWPLCVSCGDMFEHLRSKVCFRCDQSPSRDGISSSSGQASAAIEYAIENPVDPRTHNKAGTVPFMNPYALDKLNKQENRRDEELREHAKWVNTAMSNSYVDAVARAEPGVRLGKPKIKSAALDARPPNEPVARYNIIVRNIINANNPCIKVVGYTPPIIPCSGATKWGVIIEDIRSLLSNFYSKKFGGFQIRDVSQFQLAYANGTKTQFPEQSLNTPFSVIWQDCIRKKNLVTTDKDVKLFKLELTALVDYPPLEDSSDSRDSDTTTTESARAKCSRTRSMMSDIDGNRPAKRIATAGASAYLTRVDDGVIETSYTVIKLTYRSLPDGQARWTRTSAFNIDIEEERFAHGATKNTYKLRIGNSETDGQVYAAKWFYNVGSKEVCEVANEVNIKHLKEELILANVAKQALKRFSDILLKKAVYSAIHLVINDPFILIVAEGHDKGLSWLVDPYLGDVAVTKFSGTHCAGSNKDSAGMTCDAFAHFSLYDSDGSFVLVDIQGIIAPTRRVGANITGEEKATLFDFMAHSADGRMGLGDRGKAGIKQFRQQHVCNTICEGLGLEALDSDLDDVDDDLLTATGTNHGLGSKDEGGSAPWRAAGEDPSFLSLEYENNVLPRAADPTDARVDGTRRPQRRIDPDCEKMPPPPPPPPPMDSPVSQKGPLTDQAS